MIVVRRMITAFPVLVSILLFVTPAHAGAPACFPPERLAARDGEEIPRTAPVPKVTVPSLSRGKPVEASRRGVIRRVNLPAGKKLVALTFDLCETSGEVAGYDGAIFDTLRRERVPATIFAGGHWLATHPERSVQLMSDPLFEIGTHSWSHRLLAGVSGPALERQVLAPVAQARLVLDDASRICRSHARAAAPLFRFPAGVCDRTALDYVNDNGLLAIEWDVVSADPSPSRDAAALVRTVAGNVRPGSIVVLHANGRGHHTAEALPAIIAALRRKVFAFATVGELLRQGHPEIADSCALDAPPVKKITRAPAPAPVQAQ